MSVRPRGKSFIVDVRISARESPTGEGQRLRVSAKTILDALRLETEIRADLHRIGHSPELLARVQRRATGGSRTLRHALLQTWGHPTRGWWQQRSGAVQRRNALEVLDILGPKTRCSAVTPAHFDHAAGVLLGRGNCPDTVTRKLQAFYRTLRFAELSGWIKRRPAWLRPTPGLPRQFLFSPELEEETAAFFLTDTLNGDVMADLFVLGIESCCRLGELLAATAADCDLPNFFLNVRGTEDLRGQRRTKNGGVRTVGLSDKAAAILKRRIAAVGKRGKLFPGWTVSKVSRYMQMARGALDDPRNREFTFHATRHTGLTRMAERGLELVDLMEQAGHGDPHTTMRYIKMAPSARRDRLRKSLGQEVRPPN